MPNLAKLSEKSGGKIRTNQNFSFCILYPLWCRNVGMEHCAPKHCEQLVTPFCYMHMIQLHCLNPLPILSMPLSCRVSNSSGGIFSGVQSIQELNPVKLLSAPARRLQMMCEVFRCRSFNLVNTMEICKHSVEKWQLSFVRFDFPSWEPSPQNMPPSGVRFWNPSNNPPPPNDTKGRGFLEFWRPWTRLLASHRWGMKNYLCGNQPSIIKMCNVLKRRGKGILFAFPGAKAARVIYEGSVRARIFWGGFLGCGDDFFSVASGEKKIRFFGGVFA